MKTSQSNDARNSDNDNSKHKNKSNDNDNNNKKDIKKRRGNLELIGITSLGYRGEALSSLAEISLLEITSHPSTGGGHVFQKILRGGKEICMNSLSSYHREKGTTIIAKDIFFNLPLRKKIMFNQKSQSTILANIRDHIIQFKLSKTHFVFFLFLLFCFSKPF